METKKSKAYLTYPYTTEIAANLLKERIRETHVITIDGSVHSARKKIPDKLLADLIKAKKAKIDTVERIVLEGKDKIFGIPNTRSRTFTMDKQKYIRVRVIADDITTLMEHVSEIKTQMAKEGYTPTICVWNSVGKVNRKNREHE